MFAKPHDPTSDFSSEQTHIALWGPSNAGKDWLVSAFNKELDYYNRMDQGFHCEICELQPGEANPIPLAVTPPRRAPTPNFEDYNFQFRRIALVRDSAHQISAQTHDIIIHNDKGANLIDSLSDRITFENTFQTLVNAQNILLILGIPSDGSAMLFPTPPQNISTPLAEPDDFALARNEQDSSPAESQLGSFSQTRQADWSRSEYLKFMQLLFASLGPTPRRNLAVCLTKSDQVNYRGEPMQILQRRYGDALLRLLEVHRQYHKIEVFVTSAAGYIRQEGRLMPNFQSQNGLLHDERRWAPVNTAAPFFWIFEQIERERLQKGFVLFRGSNQKNYIPYPKSQSF